MKHFTLTITTLLLSILFITPSSAQSIDSLKIIPANPAHRDSVWVVAYTSFPSSGCALTSESMLRVSSNITVTAEHEEGGATTPCQSVDTISLMTLYAETYTLTYELYTENSTAIADSKTIEFTVGPSTGLEAEDAMQQRLTIFPNPAHSQVTITLDGFPTAERTIEVFSATGQRMKMVKNTGNEISLDLSGLTDGVYFIKVTDSEGQQWTEKVSVGGR